MECWSEKTLICFVMFDDDEVLVSLPSAPDSERLVTVAESDNPSQNGINFDHWSLNNCPLSQKTSSQARHLSSAIAVIVTVTRFMSSRAPHTLPSVSVIILNVKVSDYHPLIPVNLLHQETVMQVCGFPGPPPPSTSDHWCPHILTWSALCHVICNAGPHHTLTRAVNKASQCQGLGPR